MPTYKKHREKRSRAGLTSRKDPEDVFVVNFRREERSRGGNWQKGRRCQREAQRSGPGRGDRYSSPVRLLALK
ncbi:uncharacterized [Tachysurus ichikawai]